MHIGLSQEEFMHNGHHGIISLYGYPDMRSALDSFRDAQSSYPIPMVMDRSNGYERAYDVYSLLLEKSQVIFVQGPINDGMANAIVAQLLLTAKNFPEKDITLYVNSPGGSVSAGLAIIDVMQHIRNDVSTVCLGMAASMGAVILAAGTKGKRYALPLSEVMIHQPMSQANGQATDIEISAKRIIKMREHLNKILADASGQDYEKICQDTDRDFWLDADQAHAYGIVDEVISHVVLHEMQENQNNDSMDD